MKKIKVRIKPPEKVKEGDIITKNFENRYSNIESYYGYTCCKQGPKGSYCLLKKQHRGRHVAWGTVVIEVWENGD
jgi:hypothetical protein